MGVGMLFPSEYEKLLRNIKKGEYGRKWQEIALDTPHVAVDAEKYIYACRNCGAWKIEEGLSLYEPNDFEKLKDLRFGDKTVRELGEMPYVMWEDLKSDYHIVKRYIHTCDKCGSRMHRVTSEEMNSLPCPECGGTPDENATTGLNWD
jgi:predicted RNA-binding Zn-ribbon protein involved in translation (DUF1610 family)